MPINISLFIYTLILDPLTLHNILQVQQHDRLATFQGHSHHRLTDNSTLHPGGFSSMQALVLIAEYTSLLLVWDLLLGSKTMAARFSEREI